MCLTPSKQSPQQPILHSINTGSRPLGCPTRNTLPEIFTFEVNSVRPIGAPRRNPTGGRGRRPRKVLYPHPTKIRRLLPPPDTDPPLRCLYALCVLLLLQVCSQEPQLTTLPAVQHRPQPWPMPQHEMLEKNLQLPAAWPEDSLQLPAAWPEDSLQLPAAWPENSLQLPAAWPENSLQLPAAWPENSLQLPAAWSEDSLQLPAAWPENSLQLPAAWPENSLQLPAAWPENSLQLPAAWPENSLQLPAAWPVDSLQLPAAHAIQQVFHNQTQDIPLLTCDLPLILLRTQR
ncbi:melanoma-associated antigen D1 [Xenopus laevis]|uniref:Melanoma-associated antigen D1 n=2 Tax=Xenopus laevis TaxID=8355 RepID=A0A1L8F5M7_XENLA|nr:melanoma-associated antigen D1 [Xenopus laevis]OCT66889.1 hypothetical protein XELAEV_18038171mg [Xenopus laevis]